ncbi:MAG: Flp family type IVb pilin [Proteobacteria bacterium]|nr:Flp family type IVb pilin [Pseudomonadota bacterium]MBU4449258.1 Flp family type IVb pilin [Pseudomonadota bacterium]MCG2771298.1 Flp family type IVb pilin [Desulfobacterales bacterium]
MKTYLSKIMAFINDEEGASAIEYGLLVGLIALAIVAGATLLGTSISNMFDRAATALDAVAP